MEFVDPDREELFNKINSKMKRMEHLSKVWETDKTDENVWFEAVTIMGEVAPLVEEFRLGVELETGQTFLN